MVDPDTSLVERCQTSSGEAFEAAFQELYALYKDRIYSTCFRVTNNQEDALDASQEAMVGLARKIGSFAYRSRFSSWVYRIALNAAIDVRRRRLDSVRGGVRMRLVGTEAELDTSPDEDSPGSNPSAQAETNEAQVLVQEALGSINPRFASILTLRYIENLSYEEVADILGIRLGTVKSRLNRAHAALKDYLARKAPGRL